MLDVCRRLDASAASHISMRSAAFTTVSTRSDMTLVGDNTTKYNDDHKNMCVHTSVSLSPSLSLARMSLSLRLSLQSACLCLCLPPSLSPVSLSVSVSHTHAQNTKTPAKRHHLSVSQ